MSTNQAHNEVENPAAAHANGGSLHHDFEKLTHGMSHEEKQRAVYAGRFGYGPLAHMRTNEAAGMLPGETNHLHMRFKTLTRRQHSVVNSSPACTKELRAVNLAIPHPSDYQPSH